MKQKRLVIERSRDITDLHHLRLMALLNEQVRSRGHRGTALLLGIDQRTVAASVKSGQLTPRVREVLWKALQYGVGSAADQQRERSDKLEARLDKMEDQLRELKQELPRGLKRLRMSLDGVRKYYAWQRRLVEQRLTALEADRGGTETETLVGDEDGAPVPRSLAPQAGFSEKFSCPTTVESGDAEERPGSPIERYMTVPPADSDEGAN